MSNDRPVHAAITTQNHMGEPPLDAGGVSTPSRASRRRLAIRIHAKASRTATKPTWDIETCQITWRGYPPCSGGAMSAFHPKVAAAAFDQFTTLAASVRPPSGRWELRLAALALRLTSDPSDRILSYRQLRASRWITSLCSCSDFSSDSPQYQQLRQRARWPHSPRARPDSFIWRAIMMWWCSVRTATGMVRRSR